MGRSHVVAEKQRLLNRVRRLRGQVDALERALIADEACDDVMRLVTATRGAINGIMAEVINGHIRTHMVDPNRAPSQSKRNAADELVSVLRTYLR
ncbi:MAG: metal/formaldehyde-sensitive transcriptional repressor [Alphaproteobacteria bacterium]|jgi:DNA-binding FrmR family transcriptional regulator|uniref:metal/formaldehyde-sensitive transcriptional repressor n=1 Tax=Sphingomonas sp. GlSt437 TaxID=3389970 RepID=UPI001AC36C9D|nr:metal/formaldehyde-sensitive transcriptional repressor [Alphaproteobacteria bacterium]